MRWVLRAAGVLAALVAVLFAVGWMLPVGHEASRSAEFTRPPEDVYALVAAVKEYPLWWSEVSRVDMLVDEPGRTTFREHMSTGPVVMSVRERTPPSRFVTAIDDPDQPFGGTWTFEIEPTPAGGARLTITERGEIYNPLFRVLARYVFGYTATMESFLAEAADRLRS